MGELRLGGVEHGLAGPKNPPVKNAGPGWSVDDIPYGTIDTSLIRDDELLFTLIACASFIEITSDLYTSNLVEYFKGDADVERWLKQAWEVEELQHGAALKRYVQAVWPEFDWEAAYRGFWAEYGALCQVELLQPTRALEMVARCVVETGTATFYRMMAESVSEPVLARIAGHISTDEVRHYKHFYNYFLRYSEVEQTGRTAVLSTLWSRAGEIDAEDAEIAFRHVRALREGAADHALGDYKQFREAVRQLARRHYPHAMAVRMFLKPLGLAPTAARMIVPSVASVSKLLLFR